MMTFINIIGNAIDNKCMRIKYKYTEMLNMVSGILEISYGNLECSYEKCFAK